VILFVPLAVYYFALVVYQKYHRSKRKRAPFTDKFLRSPGQSLNEQIQELNEEININLMSGLFLPIIIWTSAMILCLKREEGSFYREWIIAALIILAIMIFYLFKSINLMKERRCRRLGYDGEIATGQELNQLMLEGYHVFHDFPADKFNIDHIIVGPDAVYAVETKTRSKPRHRSHRDNYKVISDGKTLQFHNYSSSEFIDQAERQSKWLQKWLSSAVGDHVTVKPILLLPGWYIERVKPDGVPVFNPKEIRQFLSNKENTLSQSLRTRIVHQLEQKCRDIEPKTVQIENQ
jgi:hypothetical protein